VPGVEVTISAMGDRRQVKTGSDGTFATDMFRENSVEVPPGATAVTLRQKSPFERT
jgi:hypothetical protein